MPRRNRQDVYPLVAGIVFLCLVALAQVVQALAPALPPLCLFRRITGLPCGTCGSTRMILAVLQGDFLHAASLNPFMFTALIGAGVWVAYRVFGNDASGLPIPRRGRPFLFGSIAALFVINWVYLLQR